jgi:Ser/Thr protein kinase RdoA (MazF antagonist)
MVRRYIHQRVNQGVFPDVEAVLRNVKMVTSHLGPKLAALGAGEQTLEIVETASGHGGLAWRDTEGNYWRTFTFVEGSEGFEICPSPEHARAVGAAFGRFVALLSDFDARRLKDPISRFQDVSMRLEHCEAAIAKNPLGRAKEAQDLIAFVQRNRDVATVFSRKLAEGALPLRVTHADPKVNNVLFASGTTKVRCLVDLDTCMAGTALYDFGDMVRSAGVPVAEDEQDLSKVRVDESLFEMLVSGYVSALGGVLVEEELRLLPLAPGVIALSLGMRFLTDHLLGDTYFKIAFPGHNLVRARTQCAILAAVQNQQPSLKRLVDSAVSQCLRAA